MIQIKNTENNPGCFGFIKKIFHNPISIFRRNSRYQSERQRIRPSKPVVSKIIKPKPLPYRIRDDFLSSAELSFYHVLEHMTGTVVVALSKVNLADIFYVSRTNEYMKHFNKINRKHVDFLMCDSKTMRPILGIELDDRSHQKQKQQERDIFVDKVFRTAGLPLVHIKASMSYDTRELSNLFRNALHDENAKIHALKEKQELKYQLENDQDETPRCPRCGEQMVLREAKHGSHKGDKFYGCANYPRCRGIITIQDLKGKDS